MFENLGSKLKTLRMKNQLSRKQVAELIGISVSMIGFYENSERLPSLPILVKLASLYKVSVDYLLDITISNILPPQNAMSPSVKLPENTSRTWQFFSTVSAGTSPAAV